MKISAKMVASPNFLHDRNPTTTSTHLDSPQLPTPILPTTTPTNPQHSVTPFKKQRIPLKDEGPKLLSLLKVCVEVTLHQISSLRCHKGHWHPPSTLSLFGVKGFVQFLNTLFFSILKKYRMWDVLISPPRWGPPSPGCVRRRRGRSRWAVPSWAWWWWDAGSWSDLRRGLRRTGHDRTEKNFIQTFNDCQSGAEHPPNNKVIPGILCYVISCDLHQRFLFMYLLEKMSEGLLDFHTNGEWNLSSSSHAGCFALFSVSGAAGRHSVCAPSQQHTKLLL